MVHTHGPSGTPGNPEAPGSPESSDGRAASGAPDAPAGQGSPAVAPAPAAVPAAPAPAAVPAAPAPAAVPATAVSATAGPGAPIRSGIPEHGRVPKYFAVKSRLEALLDELGEGGVLPTERELAARFEVSRETLRQALRDLLIQGRVRRRGRSTVVAGPKLEQPLSLASYTEGVRRQGHLPGRTLIGLERLPADPVLARQLGIDVGGPAWHLERVLLADGERVGLESTYLAVARVPGLDREFDPGASLYAFLAEKVGIAFGSAEERIETVLATPREALLIGTPPALPMLLLHRLTRDADDRPLERVRSLYRGDRFSFTTRLDSLG